MSLFDRIVNFFSGPAPTNVGIDPAASKDTFLQASISINQIQSDPNIIKDIPINNSAYIDRDRLVDHAFNLNKDIGRIYDGVKDNFTITGSEIQSLKDSANDIVVQTTKFVAKQLPTSSYGYRPQDLELALDIFSNQDQTLAAISLQIDKFAQHSFPVGAQDAHREIISKISAFLESAKQIIQSNSLLSFRKYPPGGLADTVMIYESSNKKNRMGFLHDGTGALFITPKEIQHIDLSSKDKFKSSIRDKYGDVLYFGLTDDGRHVIHQMGMRSCGASVTNMVLMDLQLKPDIQAEYYTNLSNNDKLISAFKNAGADRVAERAVAYDLPWQQKLEFLTNELSKGGPLILSVGGEIGGHYIILDKIDNKTGLASIRDPYHGWAIQCSADGIAKRFGARAISFY